MTVIIAFVANILVAIAKTVAAVLTGSASMVAEAAHSWADAGNETFLLFADRRSTRPKDPRHPLGFGRDAYIWSLFAALGVFVAGAAVSVANGVQELFIGEGVTDPLVAYIVLGASFVLEGTSFLQSVRQARRAGRRFKVEPLEYVLDSSQPTLRAVFAEDSAALAGLVIAALGIFLDELTGLALFDALGSIIIGLLLAVVAIFLIRRNRQFLLGGAVPDPLRSQVRARLERIRGVRAVTYLHVEFVGPGRLFVVAAVDLPGDPEEPDVASQLRRLEDELETEDAIEAAVLTVAVSGDPPLGPTDSPS